MNALLLFFVITTVWFGCGSDMGSPPAPTRPGGAALVGDSVWSAKPVADMLMPPQSCVGAVGPQCGWVGADGVGWVSVGSILHDNCCIQNWPNGFHCNNKGPDQKVCADEWAKAERDFFRWRQWRAQFIRQPDGTRVASRLLAPDGTRLDRTDAAFCESQTFWEEKAMLDLQGFGTCGCAIRGTYRVTGYGSGPFLIQLAQLVGPLGPVQGTVTDYPSHDTFHLRIGEDGTTVWGSWTGAIFVSERKCGWNRRRIPLWGTLQGTRTGCDVIEVTASYRQPTAIDNRVCTTTGWTQMELPLTLTRVSN